MRQRTDFSDPTFAGEVSDKIASILGWRRSPHDPGKWGDPHARTCDFEYFGFEVEHAFPIFDPFDEPRDALFAAQRIARSRRVPFVLSCSPDGNWRAAFRLGGSFGDVSAFNTSPSPAICEAVVKLSEIPDPRKLFA